MKICKIKLNNYKNMFYKIDPLINVEKKILEEYSFKVFPKNTFKVVVKWLLNQKYCTEDQDYNIDELSTFYNKQVVIDMIVKLFNIITITVLNNIEDLDINNIEFDGYEDEENLIVRFKIT